MPPKLQWPELQGSVDLEFHTDSVLGMVDESATSTQPRAPPPLLPPPPQPSARLPLDPAQRRHARRERDHERQMSAIRQQIELQRAALEEILHPADLEQRIHDFRERERVVRAERQERIRERYERSKQLAAAKLAKKQEAAPPPRPPPKARPLGYLPPIFDRQDVALQEVKRAKAAEHSFQEKVKQHHHQVTRAAKQLVVSILASGVDRKGFVRTEATIVQQFARALVSRRLVEKRKLRSPSPVVLSLVKGRPAATNGSEVDVEREAARILVEECVGNAKILLTKEYVLGDVQWRT